MYYLTFTFNEFQIASIHFIPEELLARYFTVREG
jgi:hypothetical protein